LRTYFFDPLHFVVEKDEDGKKCNEERKKNQIFPHFFLSFDGLLCSQFLFFCVFRPFSALFFAHI